MAAQNFKMLVAVVDDDGKEGAELSEYIKTVGDAGVERFSSGEDFFANFVPGKYGMIFMDIYMCGQTGVETVKNVRRRDPKVFIAFVTNSTDHAMEAYRLHVNRYIEKPFDKHEVRDILLEAKTAAENVETIDFGKGVQAVEAEKIVCIEQQAHMAVLYFSDGSSRMIRKKITDMIGLFEGKRGFYQCHRSFIINVAHVKYIDEELLIFSTDIGKNVHIKRGELGRAKRELTQFRLDRTRNI